MKSTKIKAVITLSLISLLCGLFGCGKAPRSARHTVSDITSVSVSCGHMNRNYAYSFRLHRQEGVWLLDAECHIHDKADEAAFESREVGETDARKLLELIDKNGLITYAEGFKKPKDSPIQATDEAIYGFCLGFSDSSRFMTSDRIEELEEAFYRLTEQINDRR